MFVSICCGLSPHGGKAGLTRRVPRGSSSKVSWHGPPHRCHRSSKGGEMYGSQDGGSKLAWRGEVTLLGPRMSVPPAWRSVPASPTSLTARRTQSDRGSILYWVPHSTFLNKPDCLLTTVVGGGDSVAPPSPRPRAGHARENTSLAGTSIQPGDQG